MTLIALCPYWYFLILLTYAMSPKHTKISRWDCRPGCVMLRVRLPLGDSGSTQVLEQGPHSAQSVSWQSFGRTQDWTVSGKSLGVHRLGKGYKGTHGEAGLQHNRKAFYHHISKDLKDLISLDKQLCVKEKKTFLWAERIKVHRGRGAGALLLKNLTACEK